MIALVALLAALLVIDWRQTLTIARNPQRWREAWNPVLGEHPSTMRVHVWFAFWLFFLGAFAWRLWDAPSTVAITAGIGCAIELACVVNNWRLGIKP